jgi:protein-disulfide isomerase
VRILQNWTVFALAALCSIGLGAVTPALAQSPAQNLREGDHVMGAEDAELLIVEYASFSCPHCASFQLNAWPTIQTEFIDTGRVRFVLRPMLTQPAQIAGIGVILAECVADDRYFQAADLLFHEQSAIMERARAQEGFIDIYNRIAGAVGTSPEALMACFQSEEMNTLVNDLAQQAFTDEIPGTPSFIVRGEILTIVQGNYFAWAGEPLLIDGERVDGRLDGDTFRRIILHFLDMPESGQE